MHQTGPPCSNGFGHNLDHVCRGNNVAANGQHFESDRGIVALHQQDSLTLHSSINLRARLGDSADSFRTYREGEGRSDPVDATDEEKVRWIERSRFHRDENILVAKSRCRSRVEFDHI